ncbi:MAG: hypothetical protein AAB733_01640 [Patescibacteria group bacterium]
MYEIKHIDPMSFGKIQAMIMGVAYLIGGILFGLGGMMMDTGVVGTWVIFAAMAAGAVIGAILGFFIGVVGAGIYNIAVRWIGGIKLEIVQHSDQPKTSHS